MDAPIAAACGHTVDRADACQWESMAGVPYFLCRDCCSYCNRAGKR